MSEQNTGGGDGDDEAFTNVNKPTDVRDEIIASLISQNEILTKQVAELTAKIDTLTERLTPIQNTNTGLSVMGRKARKRPIARPNVNDMCMRLPAKTTMQRPTTKWNTPVKRSTIATTRSPQQTQRQIKQARRTLWVILCRLPVKQLV